MPTQVDDPILFVFSFYGSAEQFRAACKRRGVAARQDLKRVYVARDDVSHVRQLARRYHVKTIDGDPAP